MIDAYFRTVCIKLVLGVVAAAMLLGCSTVWRAQFIQPKNYTQIDPDAPFLKCHTKYGEVFVFDQWKLDFKSEQVQGNGIQYDAKRNRVSEGSLSVPMKEVVLLETNRPEQVVHANLVVLGVVTGASIVGSALCLSNPKACFGSCPTFYTTVDGHRELHAEGFSSAVARVLEETDVDSMMRARPVDGRLELLMTNDALETHAVRDVTVLAAPRPPSGRVFRAGDLFYPSESLHPPDSCRFAQGDCLALLTGIDEQEYHSPADGEDLAAKETIELVFPAVDGALGLVISGRNSLMNTFLFYQTLAYMGVQADDWLMQLETGGKEAMSLFDRWSELLSGVEVFVFSQDRGWVKAGVFDEIGPIAKEAQLIALPSDAGEGPIRIRLRMTKGYWKLDYAALARLGKPVTPIRIPVEQVEKNGNPDPDALRSLRDPSAHLLTYPGDAYNLVFSIPQGHMELFLESTGFYYEWIRQQWLSETDQDEAAQVLVDPDEALRRLAPAYKEIESSMEEVFWNSRIGRGDTP